MVMFWLRSHCVRRWGGLGLDRGPPEFILVGVGIAWKRRLSIGRLECKRHFLSGMRLQLLKAAVGI